MLTKLYANGAAFLHTLKNDQRGVTAIEYAVVAVAISTLVAAVFSSDTGSLYAALKAAITEISSTITAVGTDKL